MRVDQAAMHLYTTEIMNIVLKLINATCRVYLYGNLRRVCIVSTETATEFGGGNSVNYFCYVHFLDFVSYFLIFHYKIGLQLLLCVHHPAL